ncbi:VOC family protein [Flavobacteriales bacterium]|jgi:extradiol dioxygenase family protein|nr:VOC family protein [Flavobacteriales bacterium]
MNPFHLAIPIHDVEECRLFYRDVMRCEEGRSDNKWVDFNLYGHQLVIHQVDDYVRPKAPTNAVDGKSVPVPHFGVVLTMEQFDDFAEHLKYCNIEFVIEPYTRFKGEVGEQSTMFFYDPAGNALEFKAFKNMDQVFAK